MVNINNIKSKTIDMGPAVLLSAVLSVVLIPQTFSVLLGDVEGETRRKCILIYHNFARF